jgi:tetratricopeptide (TPR) repeat protein
LEIAHRIGDVQGEVMTLGNMGLAYANLGEYRRAIELYQQSMEIARRIGDIHGEGNGLANMGVAFSKLGKEDNCRECLLAARAIFERLGLEHMVRQVERMMKSCGVKE